MPGLGGPNNLDQQVYRGINDSQADLNLLMSGLDSSLTQSEIQLQLLRSNLADKNLINERRLAGRPIAFGWQSSQYGMRTDPFTGEQRWHAGVDFAGRLGSDIIAVASGVITWSGEKRAMARWLRSITAMGM